MAKKIGKNLIYLTCRDPNFLTETAKWLDLFIWLFLSIPKWLSQTFFQNILLRPFFHRLFVVINVFWAWYQIWLPLQNNRFSSKNRLVVRKERIYGSLLPKILQKLRLEKTSSRFLIGGKHPHYPVISF